MSDVIADAETMMQNEMDEIANELDPVDLYTVLVMLADAEGVPTLEAFLNSSTFARDLIQYSQSNPAKTHEVLLRMAELDEGMSNL